MTACLCLPESIDNGAAFAADMPVVPHPCLGIYWLSHRSKQAQTAQVRARWMNLLVGFACLDQRTNRRWSRVKDRAAMPFDHLPKARRIGIGRYAFKNNLCRPDGKWAIGNISMTCHPAHIGRTPKYIASLDVKSPLHRELGVKQIAARCMLNALGLTRGT